MQLETEMTEFDPCYRSPELRAEIARGKRPVAIDPNKDAFDSLQAAFHARRGPFDLMRFRPPSTARGTATRGDLMVRLAMMKRAIQDGDVFVKRLLQGIGHEPEDMDRAMAHWRAEYLESAKNNALQLRQPPNPRQTGVTITALEA